MIKTVIFDVDDTLYSFTEAHETACAVLTDYAYAELGLDRELFRNLVRETMDRLQEYMGDVAAVHNRTIRFQNLLEERGLPLYPHVLRMDAIYWDTLIEHSKVSPGTPELCAWLKERGIRIGIGTDMTARVQFRKLEKLGLLPWIDFVVSSEEAGAEKPSPVFFARCTAKAGCEAGECLFVGDSLKKDVRGSMAAGMKGVWYCPEGERPEEDVLQITEMAQISRIIQAL